MSRKLRRQSIINECVRQGVLDKRQISYVVATAWHETNATYMPVREAYWVRNRMLKKYGEKKGSIRFESFMRRSSISKKYYPYYGRGLVQITWLENYIKFKKILEDNSSNYPVDIVTNLDIALEEDISIFILVYGMIHGTFTGKKISDYINSGKEDYINARRVINGKDMARKIARRARRENVVL